MNITITHKPAATIGKFTLQLDGEVVHVSNNLHPSELLSLIGMKLKFILVAE